MPVRLSWLCVALFSASAFAGPPVSLDDRLTVELVAQNPQLVTPTGVACDVRGNAWVIESNTHFPPKDYKRHESDQIWVFSGFDERYPVAANPRGLVGEAASGGGLTQPATAPSTQPAISQTLFADGFQQAMSLLVTPKGRVYVACRNEIVLLEDKDHDLKPDGPAKTLVKLDTKATYPHNGLNGVTLSPDGEYLYFCLGLNAGYDYTVIGSDGSKVAGGGEGGSIWRCTPDGGKVERIAFGFWNCHDLTFDAFGRLFAVDNDPDDIGPCRLLDIIEGGDYGWHFKNGRKGVHPFTSWNGELPGTLPMVSGTGEAPSGILAYESDNLPDDYRGQLLVTSWGDHVIQRFQLKEKGASFESKPVNFIRGGEDFRPVGIAQASDGSVFVTDWVDKSYTLHGKGKLWRIKAKTQSPSREPSGSAAGLRADQVPSMPMDEVARLLTHPKREIREAAARTLVNSGKPSVPLVFKALCDNSAPRGQISALRVLAAINAGDWNEAYMDLDERKRGLTNEAVLLVATAMATPQGWESLVRPELVKNDPGPLTSARMRTVIPLLPLEAGDVFAAKVLSSPAARDPFVASAAITRLATYRDVFHRDLEAVLPDIASWNVLHAIAIRRSGSPTTVLRQLLQHRDQTIRRLALQWVGEDRLVQFKDNIADALKSGDVNRDLLAAYLACKEKLATAPPEPGKLPAEKSGRQFAADFLFDETNDLKLRKIALDLIDPADPKLPAKKLIALVGPMGFDAIKALAWRADEESQTQLQKLAADQSLDESSRREAIIGLARTGLSSPESKKLLASLAMSGPMQLRTDALRGVRGGLGTDDAKQLVADLLAAAKKPELGSDQDKQEWAEQVQLAFKPNPEAVGPDERKAIATLVKSRPTTTADWQKATAEGGDVENGRRLFSLATGGRCYICHQVGERGGVVGPNLGRVASAMDRAKIVESILEPSKEIAPLYVPVVLELKDGRTISGIPQNEAGAGNVTIADVSGQRIRIKADDIVSRRNEKLSLMPDGLVDTMTVREFRDLVAYLIQLK